MAEVGRKSRGRCDDGDEVQVLSGVRRGRMMNGCQDLVANLVVSAGCRRPVRATPSRLAPFPERLPPLENPRPFLPRRVRALGRSGSNTRWSSLPMRSTSHRLGRNRRRNLVDPFRDNPCGESRRTRDDHTRLTLAYSPRPTKCYQSSPVNFVTFFPVAHIPISSRSA